MSDYMILSVKDFETRIHDALAFALDGGIVLIGGANGDDMCPPIMLLKPKRLSICVQDSMGNERWLSNGT